MIKGMHTLIYSKDPQGMRAFFRDILDFPSVDDGDGWLIFALPPAELGIHPNEGETFHQLSFMCDDIYATVKELQHKGVKFTQKIQEQEWVFGNSHAAPGRI